VGATVGVSTAGETSVGGVAVGKGAGVSFGRIGGEVGAGAEQEIRRRIQKAESRTRDVMCWGMKAILTEINY
jgi:hypothetical protein